MIIRQGSVKVTIALLAIGYVSLWRYMIYQSVDTEWDVWLFLHYCAVVIYIIVDFVGYGLHNEVIGPIGYLLKLADKYLSD